MSTEAPRILVAEDNGGDSYLIREALREQEFDFSLETVDDGETMFSLIDALSTDTSKPCPDLIVLDLNLPRRSGEEVFDRLRRNERCADVPVIVITASDSPRDRERAMALRAAAFFKKPADLDGFMQIGSLIREVLKSQPAPGATTC